MKYIAKGKSCAYCHKMNHTIDECYSKQGYPPCSKRDRIIL